MVVDRGVDAPWDAGFAGAAVWALTAALTGVPALTAGVAGLGERLDDEVEVDDGARANSREAEMPGRDVVTPGTEVENPGTGGSTPERTELPEPSVSGVVGPLAAAGVGALGGVLESNAEYRRSATMPTPDAAPIPFCKCRTVRLRLSPDCIDCLLCTLSSRHFYFFIPVLGILHLFPRIPRRLQSSRSPINPRAERVSSLELFLLGAIGFRRVERPKRPKKPGHVTGDTRTGIRCVTALVTASLRPQRQRLAHDQGTSRHSIPRAQRAGYGSSLAATRPEQRRPESQRFSVLVWSPWKRRTSPIFITSPSWTGDALQRGSTKV